MAKAKCPKGSHKRLVKKCTIKRGKKHCTKKKVCKRSK